MKSPLTWIGGKALLAPWIISQFPAPDRWGEYIELFCGAAHMYFRLAPCPAVLNDINSEIINFFKVLRNPRKRKKLAKKLTYTPYSRELFGELCEAGYHGSKVERAWQFFVLCKMCFSGGGDIQTRMKDTAYFSSSAMSSRTAGWLPTKGRIKMAIAERGRRGMAASTSRFRYALGLFDQAADVLQTAIIENLDFRDLLARKGYKKETALVYADPPYIKEGVILNRYYGYSWAMEDFEDLAELLNAWPGPVIFSNYLAPIFDKLFPAPKWRRVTKEVAVTACGGAIKPRVIEGLWMNYPESQMRLNLGGG